MFTTARRRGRFLQGDRYNVVEMDGVLRRLCINDVYCDLLSIRQSSGLLHTTGSAWKSGKFNSSLISLNATAVLKGNKGRIEEKGDERDAFRRALGGKLLSRVILWLPY